MNGKPSDAAVSAWVALVRAGQSVLAAVEADLKAAGFPSLAWYDALLELRGAGEAGLRPVDLEHRMLLAQYNVSRLVDRLARAGYVRRRPCPDDARASLLTVTAEGRDLQRRMWPVYAAAIERHLGAKLGDGEAAELARLLGSLRKD
ncbi:transcriptional regulator, MarR family protein [alpha proteobacterium BAL199]|nr:transcriptional regulator, MarR family protein [alpha proteobacterium BAL199]